MKHLIVCSVDALVYEDLEYAKTLPMFGKIMENGAIIEKVKTIYPSLTHPVHYTMMTGCPAGDTRIVSNETFEVGNMQRPWFNYMSETPLETIFHRAKKAGLVTAASSWPGTAGGQDVIDYLVPEYFDEDIERHKNNPIDLFRELGTREEIIDIVENAINRCGITTDHPNCDELQILCAAEIIRRYKPNLLICHPGLVDGARHKSGLFTDQVNKAIKQTDDWLQMLWNAVCDAGIEDETDFVIVSDHGHLNICRIICPNVYLADAGLIKLDDNKNITQWDAYIASCALSGQVYLSRPDDKELYNKVYTMLKDMAQEKIYGFESVFTCEEVKEMYGLYGDFSFVIETDGYTSFDETPSRPLVRGLNTDDYRYGKSTHGHRPEKGPQPVFMGMGPSFRKGVVLPHGNILNHAPTFAKILGIDLPGAKGEAVAELLK